MYRLVSHPLLVKHTNEVAAAVEEFKQTTAMNVLLPLLHLDLARGDIAQFLNSCLKEVCAREESKVLIEAFDGMFDQLTEPDMVTGEEFQTLQP